MKVHNRTIKIFNISLIIFFLFTSIILNGQSIILEVIGSAGDIITHNNKSSIHWCVGEIMSEKYENNFVLTQGLYQNLEVSTSIFETSNQYIAMEFFPNPTTNQLNYIIDNDIIIQIEIINLHGQIIKKYNSIQKEGVIDLSNIPSGLYILKIYDNHVLIKLYKIQKIGY
jgi:hypothetical protein